VSLHCEDDFTPLEGYKTAEVRRVLTTDAHLKVLWPRQVKAFQELMEVALTKEDLTLEDVRSMTVGISTLTPSPMVKGQIGTEGLVRFESYKGRLSFLYPELEFLKPTKFSDIVKSGMVNEVGSQWHSIMEHNGVDYVMPMSNMDVIHPVEILEEFGVTAMTQKFSKGAYVVRKLDKVFADKNRRSVIMSRLEVNDKDFKIPVRVGKPQMISTCSAERFAVGVVLNEGVVDFPYDRMTCRIPCKVGEVYLFGEDVGGNWYPIDVVSKNRNLRMSILKGLYGTCKGSVSLLYSTQGQLILSDVGIVTLLRSIRLNVSGRVNFREGYSDGAVAWLDKTFRGCAFEFEEIFGYSALSFKIEREDYDQEAVRDKNLHYEVTIEEFMRGNCVVGDSWVSDVKAMLGKEVMNREDLFYQLVQNTDYAFIDGRFYLDCEEVSLTAGILHELWFAQLGFRFLVSGDQYALGFPNKKGVSRVMTNLNIGGYMYTNFDNQCILITCMHPDILKSFSHVSEIVQPKVLETQKKMLGRGEVFHNGVKVDDPGEAIKDIPILLGVSDWKSRLNVEMQARGIPLIKYEHEVKDQGVPWFRCFVHFDKERIQGDEFKPSKRASELEVAGKIFERIMRKNIRFKT